MELFEKLQKVQSKLNVPKNQVNKFGGYNYRSCEDILEAANPVLAEVGAALVVGDEIIQMGDRYYVKATAVFIDTDTGESVMNSAYAREAEDKKGMDPSQITGSASSYARKYALNGLFCLDDVKDADATNTEPKSRSKKAAPEEGADLEKVTKISEAMVRSIEGKITEYASRGVTRDGVMKRYGVKSLDEMSVEQYRDCMDKFELYKKEDAKQ
ncbi:MAG: ERF family protein [Bacteroidales bacterium]|nr:ERF family protein [Bacteroidales bacterium]